MNGGRKKGGRGWRLRWGWWGSEHQAVVLICNFFSDDAKTVTLPPSSPLPLHLHPVPPLSLWVSPSMPRACWTGDSITQQVSLVTSLLPLFLFFFSPHSFCAKTCSSSITPLVTFDGDFCDGLKMNWCISGAEILMIIWDVQQINAKLTADVISVLFKSAVCNIRNILSVISIVVARCLLSERRGSQRLKEFPRRLLAQNEKMDLLYGGNELCEIQSCWS